MLGRASEDSTVQDSPTPRIVIRKLCWTSGLMGWSHQTNNYCL